MEAEKKFGADRAAEYAQQSAIALAGYEACHELTACLLSAVLGQSTHAKVLVVGGGGTGMEIITAGKLEENWEFMAVDPSEPMLDIARTNISKNGFLDRTSFHHGYVDDLDLNAFDAAIMFGVIHHVAGSEEKRALLSSIGQRLRPGSPFIMSGNRYRYSDKPTFLKAWKNRWRLAGASFESATEKLNTILKGADPPASEEEVEQFLTDSGFTDHSKFFSSLFWSSWLTFKTEKSWGEA